MTTETRARAMQEFVACATDEATKTRLQRWWNKWVKTFALSDPVTEDQIRTGTMDSNFQKISEAQCRMMAEEFMRAKSPVVVYVGPHPTRPEHGMVIRRSISCIWDGQP